MAAVMLCCIATPYLAKFIDKKRPQPPHDDSPKDPNEPTVRGPYDASSDKDYDLNYKIYNTDIYGVDFKNGKKRKNGRGNNINE
jgi:hypothetical protein